VCFLMRIFLHTNVRGAVGNGVAHVESAAVEMSIASTAQPRRPTLHVFLVKSLSMFHR
jgi:hypothetical protein